MENTDYTSPPIPLADLPTFADTAILLGLLLGSASPLLLLGLDAWHSRCKKTHWIRGNSLVLGALSLQLLGLVSLPAVNISDSQKLNQDSLEKMMEVIIGNNLFLAFSGRAVTCVFIGNMLPDVARSRDHNVWSNMIALSISATGVLIHLCYEIFIYIVWTDGDMYDIIGFYLVANIIIFASIGILVLFLGCAALSSKSIHEVVAQRIPVLLSRSEYRNPRSVVSWKAFEEQAVRSWITARTCQPDYIIARSVLSSSIAFLVTICVVFCLRISIWGWIEYETFVVSGYRDDWLRSIAVAVQWIFVLVGWAMVSWRWLTAVVFFPRRMVLYNLHNSSGLIELGNDGDFAKYLESLMYMLGENPAGLWIANLKSIELLKLRLTEAESHGKNCKAKWNLNEIIVFSIC